MFDATGNYHASGFMSFISELVSLVSFLLEVGGLWGTPLAIASMPGCCATLREPFLSWRYTLTLTGTGLLLTGISIATSLDFFFIEPGSSIRPMEWVGQQFLLLFAGIAAALLFGPLGVKSDAPRWLRWLGVLLCLAPLPAGLFLLRWAMRQNGLEMGD